MSNTSTEISSSKTCANCGKEGSDVTNSCNKCNSVIYCNAACKKKHRHKHKKDCERRVAQLRDEKLFKQPPPADDCPICMVRLPSMESGQVYMVCCGKVICRGCVHAFQARAAARKKDDICPFCRTPPPESDDDMIKRYEKRVDLNDTEAIFILGCYYARGEHGLPRNRAKASELWHRAAELGHATACNNIGHAYKFGIRVEWDEKRAVHYWELAAMSGDVFARHNLGCIEEQAGNMDRALKHLMIAIKDGHSDSLENIKSMYMNGDAAKDDYGKALILYQAYLSEIKSDQRDEAAAFDDYYKYYGSMTRMDDVV